MCLIIKHMFVHFEKPGPLPSSEIVMDLVEDALGGHCTHVDSSSVLYGEVRDLRDACESAARDAILNPTCYDPAVSELDARQRRRAAAEVKCDLQAQHERDEATGRVTLRAWCGRVCQLRPHATADPGLIVISNTYPVVMKNYRDNRS
jgi:hypothetical protein